MNNEIMKNNENIDKIQKEIILATDAKKLKKTNYIIASEYENITKEIKELEDKFNKNISYLKNYKKLLTNSINEVKKLVLKNVNEKIWQNTYRKIDESTGEVKEKIYNNLPKGFGILKAKEKIEIDMERKYPASCYDKVINFKKVFDLVEQGKLSQRALKVTKTGIKISWLPKNILNSAKIAEIEEKSKLELM